MASRDSTGALAPPTDVSAWGVELEVDHCAHVRADAEQRSCCGSPGLASPGGAVLLGFGPKCLVDHLVSGRCPRPLQPREGLGEKAGVT